MPGWRAHTLAPRGKRLPHLFIMLGQVSAQWLFGDSSVPPVSSSDCRRDGGRPEPHLGSAEQSSWQGRHPLGKGGVLQVSECIPQQPRGCLFSKGLCRKLKRPKVTMTPWYRRASLSGETEGVSISLFHKLKGQFINLQQEVEPQEIGYLGPQQKKVMTKALRPGIRFGMNLS